MRDVKIGKRSRSDRLRRLLRRAGTLATSKYSIGGVEKKTKPRPITLANTRRTDDDSR